MRTHVIVCATALLVAGCEAGTINDGRDSGRREGGTDGAVSRDGGGTEICDNGFDDNGDGRVDENCACAAGATQRCFPGDPMSVGRGVCAPGTQRCDRGTWGACTGAVAPTAETCDGLDNDCDGMIDEECPCAPGMRRECYGGPPGTAGVGACRPGLQTCGGDGMWGVCENVATPGFERCDGVDNDCDGMTDEGCNCRLGFTRGCYSGTPSTVGVGACREGVQTCQEEPDGTSTWGDCMGMVVPLAAEMCNGVDDNCDGRIDEGCTCSIGLTRPCYTGPVGTAGVGICRNGMQACVMVGQDPGWGPCTGSVTPVGETCNGMDDDCNGRADESCLCGPGQTATYRIRDLTRMSVRSEIQPGDGLPTMPMTCEMRRCPDGQVAVQSAPGGSFVCVPPPPACPAGSFANWVSSRWRCDPPCEVLITYGHLYGNRVLCAPRPRITCPTGQAPTFVYETETWQCRPMCNNGQYDIRTYMGLTVCIPC